jgi:hypothetical protein
MAPSDIMSRRSLKIRSSQTSQKTAILVRKEDHPVWGTQYNVLVNNPEWGPEYFWMKEKEIVGFGS